MKNKAEVVRRWQLLSPYLNRQQWSLWAATEAEVIGRGGVSVLAGITGLASQTISRRARILEQTEGMSAGSLLPVSHLQPRRPRESGTKDLKVASELEVLLREEAVRNPTGRKKCVRTSLGMLRRRLEDRGVYVEPKTISVLMRRLGYRLKLTRRKPIEIKDPGIEAALQSMLCEEAAGDPMGRQKWVRSSLRNLSKRLDEQGHKACTHTVARLLRKMGYSLQVAQKQRVGAAHPDRDQQFKYIAELKEKFLREGLPVISIDTKKKELIGNYRREGKNWRREPIQVDAHFAGYAKCVAVPFGIYDLAKNAGYVTVGISGNTSEFAVSCLEQWWQNYGQLAYGQANRVLILADGGGGNGYNHRSWKKDLQDRLCDVMGLTVTISHYPTGCSRWNPIEYRLFSHISMNWAGQPLRSLDAMLAFIRGTTTQAGLTVEARLDQAIYRKGRKVTKAQLAALALSTDEVCPLWNYTIAPRAANSDR
ncbi:ISAzo13 family transposase [Bradyrhizobium sp. NAS96.2]|uniref:ISAzo13 family transposase n=1 Tax=Bradyrhizobium sp. NAS96.2 TaxID=1680160 RepID=UPI0009F9CE16|nr:ISAzo13 family transposase [Bradyrhizobium sp. NAS96.2]